MAMKKKEIETILTEWLAAWRRADASALAAAFAEDADYTGMLTGTIRGRKAVEALYRSWFAAFPDMDFTVESRLVHGDHAAVLWSQNGTHKGEFCGLAGTGRIFIIPGAFFLTFGDGKITRLRSIYDFTGLLLQIGILTAKPSS
jgi:steroid delta-isomerase-like uncharacterized protein